ncbi:hypothetical protein MBM_01371 [Drepanopeziza brunnea f. sp. 'multigermtubi' MB_m1]|uniref:Uncharacterized protein n=1 Tax=Marssonina brunnea f. sp. multigermtubi (strain MB_m1) TaxID=1072389 RepID=K1Y689_MARBU|nr:uncharacterized protein MBM_01371 [Drepanopeziza brunnea f. sp. 'multigermtubi' MB_m1]EKD20689.1 hypothetical protein MBM_01371 [Drepanopeziza brunnea f. sp. 'multigermtubi' MB_m1]
MAFECRQREACRKSTYLCHRDVSTARRAHQWWVGPLRQLRWAGLVSGYAFRGSRAASEDARAVKSGTSSAAGASIAIPVWRAGKILLTTHGTGRIDALVPKRAGARSRRDQTSEPISSGSVTGPTEIRNGNLEEEDAGRAWRGFGVCGVAWREALALALALAHRQTWSVLVAAPEEDREEEAPARARSRIWTCGCQCPVRKEGRGG